MKISIITVTFNSAKTVALTLQSVAEQTYSNIEHIVIDGKSNDNTLSIINDYAHVTRCISEPDKGMYDALNKGIKLATGDYIGILNSDDILHDQVTITDLVTEIQIDSQDAYFADIRFIKPKQRKETLRYYSSAKFHPNKFEYGYMPAHPSFYCKKSIYDQLGYFQTNYKIAADYELLSRFIFKHKIKTRYLPVVMVDMLPGGLSNQTIFSRWLLNKEIIRACQENGISTNMWKLSLKYFRKIFEYLPFLYR